MDLAQTMIDELERMTAGGKLMRPPRTRGADGRWSLDRQASGTEHGEWDWFYSLPDPERSYVQAHYMTADGLHPDVVADLMGCSTDEAMHQWVSAIRAVRQAKRSRRRADEFDQWEEPEQDWHALPDYIGTAGIAVIMSVSDATPRQWRKRGRLPEPTYLIDDMHPVWSRQCIGAWLEQIRLYAHEVRA